MLPHLTALFVLFWRCWCWRPVFWGRQLKKCQLFKGNKCIRMIWLEDFLTSKWSGSFTALAPPLKRRKEKGKEGKKKRKGREHLRNKFLARFSLHRYSEHAVKTSITLIAGMTWAKTRPGGHCMDSDQWPVWQVRCNDVTHSTDRGHSLAGRPPRGRPPAAVTGWAAVTWSETGTDALSMVTHRTAALRA